MDDVVAVVRTSKRTSQNPKCQPIYVSIGSGIKNLDLAVEIVLSVCKFKIPEPIRNADKESRNILKNTVSNINPISYFRLRSRTAISIILIKTVFRRIPYVPAAAYITSHRLWHRMDKLSRQKHLYAVECSSLQEVF